MITRRCTQRQFLLKPTKLTCQIFGYVVALAAERTGIVLHAICVNSNHWHAVVTDPRGELPRFVHYVHTYVGKCVNASLGRWENLFDNRPPSVVRIETGDDLLRKIVYTLCNPVAAWLVKRGSRWPGLRGFARRDGGLFKRPKVFFREGGPTPAQASLRFSVPPQWAHLSAEAFEALVQREVAAKEAALRAKAKAEGRNFLGAAAVMRQKVTDTPQSVEQRRGLSPKVAAKDKWRRIEALQRNRAFLADYRAAFARFKQGVRDVLFPAGTYALRVHAGIACHSP